MKNKKLFKRILLIVLAVIVLGGIAGGIYYYKTLNAKKQITDTTVKEQEQVIENKSNSTRTSIDDKWGIYTNYKLGFSIEIPKESVMDNISGSKALVEVIEPIKWSNTIHIVAATQENIKWHQDKINNAKNELESVRYVPFGILIRENINNDEDIKKFIQERYGEKCGILEKENTSQKGVFDIRIAGSGSIGSEGSCAIMWRYALKYDSNNKKLASWDGGQDYGFRTENTINGVDDEMNDSFRFIEQLSIQNNLNNNTSSPSGSSSDLNSWETYKNEAIGFEFQYPAQFTFTSAIKYWDEEKKKPGKEARKDYMGSRFYGALYLDNDRKTYFHLVFLSSDYKETMGRGASFEDYNRYVFKEDENKYYFGRFWDDKLDEITNPVEKITVNNKEGIIIDYSNFLKENRCEAAGIALPYMGALVRTGIDKYPLANISFSDELTDSEKCTFTKAISDEEAVKIIKSFKFIK